MTLFLIERNLQDAFQLVNSNLFERVILMKWLYIYLLLKPVRLLDFLSLFVPYFTSLYAVDCQKGQDKKGRNLYLPICRVAGLLLNSLFPINYLCHISQVCLT